MIQPIIEQQEILDAVMSGKNVSVNAVPGGGKTTLLCLIDEVLKSEDFVSLTFSRALADEVSEKFKYGKVSTLHAYLNNANKKFLKAKSISPQVQKIGKELKRTYINENLLYFVVNRYLKDAFGITKHVPSIVKAEFYSQLNQLEFLVNKICAQALDYRNPIAIHEKFDSTYTPQIVEDAIAILNKLVEHFFLRAEYDFTGMLYMSVMHSEVARYVKQPKILAIDETNDSNPLMQRCYQMIAGEDTQVILVGDSNQCIHVWNGCAPDSLQQLSKKFNCIDIAYNVTFRVPVKMVQYLNDSGLDTGIKTFESNKQGKIENISLNKMLMSIKNGEWILGRFNRSKNKNAISLEKLSIDFLTLGKRVRLLGSDYIEICQAMIEKVDNVSKISFRNVITEVKKAVAVELSKIAEETSKESWKYRKLENDLEIFVLYFNFYCRKVGMPTSYDFINFLTTMYADDENCITLMTYHKSKGKEHHTIYLLHTDIINADITNEELDLPARIEAKNLLYVGLTRSNDRTFIVDGNLPASYPTLTYVSNVG